MEKVKLTLEQSDAIERNFSGNPQEFPQVREYLIMKHPHLRGMDESLNDLSKDELCRVLYVGAIKPEPDQNLVLTEKMRFVLRTWKDQPLGEENYWDGVKDVLELLGATVKGINDKEAQHGEG